MQFIPNKLKTSSNPHDHAYIIHFHGINCNNTNINVVHSVTSSKHLWILMIMFMLYTFTEEIAVTQMKLIILSQIVIEWYGMIKVRFYDRGKKVEYIY